MILPMISYQNHMISPMISLSSDISHDFIANSPWYGCLISVSSDIIAMWYHTFPDMLAYIMAPARRDGAAWGRQALGAPPPPASPQACNVSTGHCQVGSVRLSLSLTGSDISTDCAGQSLALLHGASDVCWCASHRGSSVSSLNLRYDCPYFGATNSLARARANVRARV